MKWPDGKSFAFTIFDDTDLAVPGNVEDVYDILGSLGMRTTKSVWPICSAGQPARGPEGSTCEDPEYLRFVLGLQRAGFEIGYHNSSHFGVDRANVIRALDRFKELFGSDPDCMSNHQVNPEAVYWGPSRLSQPLRAMYALFRANRGAIAHGGGHEAQSPHFWGDICQHRIRYVRNFVFANINTLEQCSTMPYFDPARPMVRAWFASSYASGWSSFENIMSEENQDQLEKSGGACILYTHFGSGFHDRSGRAQPRFRQLVQRLAGKNGWFVPVRELLDYLVAERGLNQLSWSNRQSLEWRWFYQKLTRPITE